MNATVSVPTLQDGLHLILPYMNDRVISAPPADLFKMLCSGPGFIEHAYVPQSMLTHCFYSAAVNLHCPLDCLRAGGSPCDCKLCVPADLHQ